jgi:hypothetical protein
VVVSSRPVGAAHPSVKARLRALPPRRPDAATGRHAAASNLHRGKVSEGVLLLRPECDIERALAQNQARKLAGEAMAGVPALRVGPCRRQVPQAGLARRRVGRCAACRRRAFDAKSGKLLWQTRLNSGVQGVPTSFEVDGAQYIAVRPGGASTRNGRPTASTGCSRSASGTRRLGPRTGRSGCSPCATGSRPRDRGDRLARAAASRAASSPPSRSSRQPMAPPRAPRPPRRTSSSPGCGRP